MFSTLNRYFSRELTLTFAAVSIVLLVVIVSKSFISLLAKVMDGKLPADVVLSILGLGIFNSAILLAPFALLITVMLTLGRLYRDSEIYAIKASGVSLYGLVKSASLLILPLVFILFYLALFSAPWSSQQIEKIKLKARGQAGIYSLTPGQFTESKRGDWVVFIEDADKELNTVNNIFIYDRRGGDISIETAQTAKQENLSELGGESLILTEGQRYEGVPGEGGFTILSFNQHALRIPEFNSTPDANDPEFKETTDLLRSIKLPDQAELQWRLSVPIAAILLVLLAFPLSVMDPRQGRFAKLGLAIVIYLIYANLLILAETWVANGKLPAAPGLFVVHFALAAVIAVLFIRQRRAG